MVTTTFRHEALLYERRDGFLSGVLPFLRAGVDAGEPMLVAVSREKIAALREALGDDAGAVRFADMAELGRNPARIIPAWEDFLAEHPGRPLRGIGEPIWAARSPRELVECQLHESLLNVAFAGAAGFRLLCPYDTGALDASVVHEACCSHPTVDSRDSRAYRDLERLLAPFETPLPRPSAPAKALSFEQGMLSEVRRLVHECGAAAGLDPERTHDLVLAAAELAANSVRHGGGRGIVRIWSEDDGLVCEVKDRGRIRDPLAGRRRPGREQEGGRGLWMANQIADLVQIRSGHDGTAVRLLMRMA